MSGRPVLLAIALLHATGTFASGPVGGGPPGARPRAPAIASTDDGRPAAQQTIDLSALGYDRGQANAPILIVEFGDFGCSACAQFARETMRQLEREFIATGRVRWKYIPFILGSFPNSDEATRAAECAADQNAFWSMHDLLYAQQKEWNRLRNPRGKLEEFAAMLALDRSRFARCYDANPRRSHIERNNAAARELLIRGTPTFFVNGRRVVGALPIEEWRKVLAWVASGA